jgi:nitrate/nitrite-specific signal transduction histidine kinase
MMPSKRTRPPNRADKRATASQRSPLVLHAPSFDPNIEFEQGKRSNETPRRASLLRRITYFSLYLALMVAVAGGISYWFATRASQNLQYMRQAADQAILISDMQSSWLEVVGTLDTFSLTRPVEGSKERLDSSLSELNQKLETLASASLGFNPAMIQENRAIAQELRGLGAEVSDLANEIYSLSEQGRWGTALQRRQVRLADLQSRLDAGLRRLDNNLQGELAARSLWIARQQAITRLLSLTAITVAFLFALVTVWVSRRTIVKPLQSLIGEVKRITAGDFSPVTPMQRNDEIGDLSRSVALMTEWLNESYEALEARVEERTRELQRRTVELQVAAAVARDVAATSNLDKLLVSAVNLIRDRFGFYHAGIFLTDARGEYAVLRAATGEAGAEMLDRGHKLRISSHGTSSVATGLVGHAAETGEAQLARDVALDPYHYKNPLLPETRSEVALPLKAAELVIGVLDVQSQIPNAFDEQSIEILQVMADQLAIAIQNARLLQEVREKLNELQSAYGRIEHQEWTRLSQTNPVIGFEFNGVEVVPLTATEKSSPTIEDANGRENDSRLSVPLRVRGEVIGSLDVWPQSGDLSEAEAYLLATISSRLSQVLESARLLAQAQRLAAREQQINLIATQMRSAVNLETILQNTVRELGKALGARRAHIQIGEINTSNGGPFSDAPDEAGGADARDFNLDMDDTHRLEGGTVPAATENKDTVKDIPNRNGAGSEKALGIGVANEGQ